MNGTITPAAQNGMPSWVMQMRDAAQQQVTQQDIEEIVRNRVAAAKKGDKDAIKFVFEQVLGGAAFKGATFVQNVYGEDSTKMLPADHGAKALLDRKALEDKATGIMCGQCGYEPEKLDRSQKCPKCNSTRWESKAGKPLRV